MSCNEIFRNREDFDLTIMLDTAIFRLMVITVIQYYLSSMSLYFDNLNSIQLLFSILNYISVTTTVRLKGMRVSTETISLSTFLQTAMSTPQPKITPGVRRACTAARSISRPLTSSSPAVRERGSSTGCLPAVRVRRTTAIQEEQSFARARDLKGMPRRK